MCSQKQKEDINKKGGSGIYQWDPRNGIKIYKITVLGDDEYGILIGLLHPHQDEWRIQDSPEIGAPTLQVGRGAPTYDFAKNSQKLHEIERIWIGGDVPSAPLRSATEDVKILFKQDCIPVGCVCPGWCLPVTPSAYTCENITFPQLLLRTVIILLVNSKSFRFRFTLAKHYHIVWRCTGLLKSICRSGANPEKVLRIRGGAMQVYHHNQ